MNEGILRDRLYTDVKLYIETFFEIKSKDRDIIPFILNPIQVHYLDNRSYTIEPGIGGRDIILKARQHGFTTLILAIFLFQTLTNFGFTSVIVGHDDEAMEKLLENARLMYNSIPEGEKPEVGYDNKGEIGFPEINSRIYISTYRMLKLRSQTVNNLLLTETAFWKAKSVGDLVAGMTESVPLNGNIIIESTPNGIGGYYWQEVMNAKAGNSIYKLLEYSWHINKTYRIPTEQWYLLPDIIRPTKSALKLDYEETRLIKEHELDLEQIMWRRYKMLSFGDIRLDSRGSRISRRFAQEYDKDFLQSGNPVFDASYLIASCNFKKPKKDKKYIHGADTSEGVEGGDYSVLYTMDYDSGEVVNKIRGLWKPDIFAMKIHEIGLKYGGLIGVENNNTGHAVLQKLVELFEEETEKRYNDIQKKASANPDNDKLQEKAELDKYAHMPYRIYTEQRRYGWSTNQLNRKTMFVEGEEALRDGSIKLAHEDGEGITELIACQYNEKMKEEAPEGMHDDSIMALLITWQMRKYYHFYFKKDENVGARLI